VRECVKNENIISGKNWESMRKWTQTWENVNSEPKHEQVSREFKMKQNYLQLICNDCLNTIGRLTNVCLYYVYQQVTKKSITMQKWYQICIF